jgi:hypothetical protein
VKLECDKVERSLFPPRGYKEELALNQWTWALKLLVPGRIHPVAVPPHTGCQPKLGHIPRPLILHPWYAQLDVDDLHMLVVPHAFQQGLKEWINIPLARRVGVSTCHFCDYWV